MSNAYTGDKNLKLQELQPANLTQTSEQSAGSIQLLNTIEIKKNNYHKRNSGNKDPAEDEKFLSINQP